MMNDKIVSTLSSLNIPIAYMEYLGTANAYVVFQIYNHRDSDFADDVSESETFYVQVNYWYNNPADFGRIAQIKALLKQNGFIYDYGRDLKDAGFYGHTLDFIYQQFN